MNPPQNRPTILIVDDDLAIRNMLVEVLTLEGYPTETATNGVEALESLAKGGPRVVLLDLLMPIMDGKGVVHALQSDEAERNRHQIILVSAMHNLEGARDLQVDGRLPKPFTVDQLLNTIAPHAAKLVH
jgi:CheY-like chemotaxis protein